MYNLLRVVFFFIFKFIFRWRVTGSENVPRQGGVMIVANHLSLWDPPLIGCALIRDICFMAKQELFEIPVFGKVIAHLGAFPVKRNSADRTAIRQAVRVLKEGKVLGLFPEGTRSKTGKLGTANPGVAMIAALSGAVIIPAAIVGTNCVFSRGHWLPRFEVRFGKPMFYPEKKLDKEDMNLFAALVMQKIGELLSGGK